MCDRLAPHQLDYDWRFTEQTAAELARMVRGKRSLLLGCPTVAEALADNASQAVLVDRQPAATCRFTGRVIQADVRAGVDDLGHGAFDVIVLDSPWYPEDLLLWLDLALRLSKVGTTILFSLWPNRTRPSAAMETEAVFQRILSRGRTERFKDALRYLTPGFEHYSMPGIGNEWRFGDLGSLSVEKPQPLGLPRPRMRAAWSRFAFDEFQVAVRVGASGGGETKPTISRIYPSWHIPTVSRRQTNLHKIEIWSSDNEVGQLHGSKHFYNALHALTLGRESSLSGFDREALTILLDHGFVPAGRYSRRLEWTQFD